jgi:hypothetical protein
MSQNSDLNTVIDETETTEEPKAYTHIIAKAKNSKLITRALAVVAIVAVTAVVTAKVKAASSVDEITEEETTED